MTPNLVRIETVRHEKDEDFEGWVGLHIDTDIDDNGHGVYTVHIPTENVDVQCREIISIAPAQPARSPMMSAKWFCCGCAKLHELPEPVRPPAPCECGGIAFEKRS